MNNGQQRQVTPLARTYAVALLGAARRQANLERVREEARLVLEVVRQTPRLLVFLESPQVKMDEKLGLLDRVFKGRLSLVMINLLHLLATRRRTPFLNSIFELFLELAEEAEGIFQATVASAVALDDGEQAALKAALDRYCNCQLRIEYEVDPALLGGIVFRFGDHLVDDSLRHGLDTLRRCLLATTVAIRHG